MLKEIIQTIERLIGSILLLLLSLVIRRRKEYVAIGSWGGENYIDNGRYLAEYICIHQLRLPKCSATLDPEFFRFVKL